ncbi:alpha/beta hydrolase [Myxococcota bacterium]|nr:alpha/beta hydrolase [Myxococcota bacterium]
MEERQVGEHEVVLHGAEGPLLALVSGPPFGAALFREVQRRLDPRRTAAITLRAPDAEGLPALSASLAELLQELGARRLVAHGLAVPVALGLPDGLLDELVLTNGPINRVDPITRALGSLGGARATRAALTALLRPRPLNAWLASSFGLRRAVVNPYTMERDIVAMVTAAWTSDARARLAAARWFAALPGSLPLRAPKNTSLTLIWGDQDPLYPLAQAEAALALTPGAQLHRIPGGQHLHPEERPWELADALSATALRT